MKMIIYFKIQESKILMVLKSYFILSISIFLIYISSFNKKSYLIKLKILFLLNKIYNLFDYLGFRGFRLLKIIDKILFQVKN
jgi:hypothetical protein